MNGREQEQNQEQEQTFPDNQGYPNNPDFAIPGKDEVVLNKKRSPGRTALAVIGILICSALIFINEGSFLVAVPKYINSAWVSVFDVTVSKPVIYLYPEEELDVDVKVDPAADEFYTTYPAYGGDGWHITAKPDGKIYNKADGEEYNYLFWETKDNNKTPIDMSKGFCVRGEDTERFLDKTLRRLGLNDNERHEFIVYWLPRMEHNSYNLIAFQYENYSEYNKLEITPEPDSVLRVFMAYKPLEKPVEIPEQEIRRFERKGFCAVEWGGTELH